MKGVSKQNNEVFLSILLGTLGASFFLIPPYFSDNFEIQKYSRNKIIFKGLYSRNDLHKIKHGHT